MGIAECGASAGEPRGGRRPGSGDAQIAEGRQLAGEMTGGIWRIAAVAIRKEPSQ
jgi:hypothetical protein